MQGQSLFTLARGQKVGQAENVKGQALLPFEAVDAIGISQAKR